MPCYGHGLRPHAFTRKRTERCIWASARSLHVRVAYLSQWLITLGHGASRLGTVDVGWGPAPRGGRPACCGVASSIPGLHPPGPSQDHPACLQMSHVLGANSWEVRLLLCGHPKPCVLSSRLTNSPGPRHSTRRCQKHRELDLTPVVLLYMTGCPVGLPTRKAAGASAEDLRGPALELWGSGAVLIPSRGFVNIAQTKPNRDT